MRLRNVVVAAAAGCLGFSSVSNSQTAPPEPSVRPASPPVAPESSAAPDAPQRATWIGIGVLPVSGAVARQLRLPAGVGLTVEDIAPNGPAARAGIEQYDVIQKLDDQLLFNPQQFGSLIRMHKPGDQIRLSVIHEGRPVEVKVTLAETILPPPAPPAAAPQPEAQPQPAPPEHDRGSPLDQIRGLKIPKVNIRIEGDQLIVEDGKGHQLFRQPLEFDLNDSRLPFSVHVHAQKSDAPPAPTPDAPRPPADKDQPAPPPQR